MKIWRIPVTWQRCGFVTVQAATLSEALDIARDDKGVLPLPPESQYVDGSWELSETDPDLIRECYNKNQKDETDETNKET